MSDAQGGPAQSVDPMRVPEVDLGPNPLSATFQQHISNIPATFQLHFSYIPATFLHFYLVSLLFSSSPRIT